MIAIAIKNLSYHYPDRTPALLDINLQVKRGLKTAILGMNGSGKTTLLYHLNGVIPVESGEVQVFGTPVVKERITEVRRMVGLLFDNPDNQLFSTTLRNDIAFGPRNLRLEPALVHRKVEEAMQLLSIEDLADRPPYCLSLGQKKRAAIAGLISMEPQVLVFDEPFSGLDPALGRQFRELLDELVSGGCTLVYSTHDVDLAYAWADEVVLMHSGRVLKSGPVDLLCDEKTMMRANLPVPLLGRLFRDWNEKPRTLEEALNLMGSTGLAKGKRLQA